MLPQLVNGLNKKFEQRFRSRLFAGLNSTAAVQRALSRERARSERSGHPFCCVLFRLDTGRQQQGLEELVSIIARRIRLTDEAGWFDTATVCAILPETNESEAHCFADDVVAFADKKAGLMPTVRVEVYPAGGGRPRRPRLFESTGQQPALKLDHKPAAVSTMQHLFIRELPWWKRLLDVAGALIGLAAASPILLAVALAVKLSSSGPVIFAQPRAGLGGKTFDIYKFRSMYVDAEQRKAELMHLNEQDGPAFKIKKDPRVTRVGRFLRKTSLDELPQLFNVIKGDMSLVGPRPPTLDEVEKYSTWYRRRLEVTPGITCIWQVHGRSRVSFEEWMRMDIQYIQHFGFWQDLRLLVSTLPALVLRRGAC
jgi:lipopolysaccharide/colanic/teichoic acid biosynthesis glycosyltransferase